ncbi:putative glycosyltransferase [Syntrophobacter sp. SbD1]|nr:putative glycosyltransferase [Syntrophobacter sp. SbD1]
MPETSIIIVSHNGLRQTTALCLESIFTIGAASDFEVIVVDNNSSDETPAYLRAGMEREPRLRCIFNKSNRGFAGGNNDGLKIASGEVLILLNSDCIVTKNWIEGLSALLQDPVIGLAGPVSNSVGNEQRIFTGGTTTEEIIEEGFTWVSNSRGGRFETEKLGFFCVALRRDVLDRVGMLDENFGLGFYEDDDYCMRVRQAGYKLICAEDVFVYHRGGGSFGELAQGTRKMMKENRRKLETKYSCRFEGPHPRQGHLRVIEGYLGQATDDGPSPQLQYKISNRLRAIESQMPRGIFKRWAFCRRLGSLKKRLAEIR